MSWPGLARPVLSCPGLSCPVLSYAKFLRQGVHPVLGMRACQIHGALRAEGARQPECARRAEGARQPSKVKPSPDEFFAKATLHIRQKSSKVKPSPDEVFA
ncbi:hypothetical protein BDR07DRAFT_1378773 [Suillus spraguei]|nr:hypothetical protein BDR07DRAFT_1378772 [Suillus spraguei]KAG2359266.1 hypothetical protein BDR07DRAFT_1378773 [Suillus spraguei]